jgi:predicted Zn-dependent peptidase
MKKTISLLNRTLMLASLTLLAAGLAMAQTPAPATEQQRPSLKGAVLKGKAPVNKEVLKVKLPKPYETRLSNGLQVLVLEDHRLPIFNMQMVILSGGLADPAEQLGVAQYTAALLREGTKTRNSRQIAEEVDQLGATLSAAAGLTSLTSAVSASGLIDNFDQIMGLFADVILNPSFPADEFDKYRTRQIAQLRLQRSQPSFLASEMFSKVIYGSHPASRIALTAEEHQRITPEKLRQFHATYYRPNNAIFAIVGDVKPAEIVAKLEKVFGSWQRGEVPQASIPKVNETGPSKIYLIDRPGSVQTNLVLGNLSIERTDPDYFALQVMNQVLGGGASARLFLNLREDKGYTYGAYSRVSSAKYRGTFQANTEVRTEVTKGSMDELLYELKRIREEKVPPDEFDRAKRTIVGSFALQLESPQSVLQNVITQKLYGLPDDYWDTYPQKVSAVTQEDVQRVARKYLDLDRLQVVAVGDAKQIAEVLKKYGPLEIYDAEGKLLKSSGPEAGSGEASLEGTWNLIANTPNGEVALKAAFKFNGLELGGTLDTPFGQFPVTGGSIKGNEVSFKVKAEVQGNPTEIQFVAKLDGNVMKGQVSSAAFPTVDFTGKKEK